MTLETNDEGRRCWRPKRSVPLTCESGLHRLRIAKHEVELEHELWSLEICGGEGLLAATAEN